MRADTSANRKKVEPRIMHVLQILIDNSPKVVTREQLISEVWNDYGGADDALNQAISHLRKLLHDTNKEDRIIETVVKKGYRFNGGTSPLQEKQFGPRGSLWKSLVLLAVLLILGWFIYKSLAPKAAPPVAPVEESPIDGSPVPEAPE